MKRRKNSTGDIAKRKGTSSTESERPEPVKRIRLNWQVSRHSVFLISILFLIFLYWLFAIRYSDFLYVVWTHEGFYLEWPTLTGTFHWEGEFWSRLTSGVLQSFAFPLLGGLVFALLITVFFLIESQTAFRGWLGIFWALSVTSGLILLLLSQKYYIFGFRSFAFFFEWVTALCAIALCDAYYRRQNRRGVRLFLATLFILILFPVFSTFSLCLGLFLTVAEMDRPDRTWKSVLFPVALVLTAPLLWYPFYAGRIPTGLLYIDKMFYREILLVEINKIMLNRYVSLILTVILFLPLFVRLIRLLSSHCHLHFQKSIGRHEENGGTIARGDGHRKSERSKTSLTKSTPTKADSLKTDSSNSKTIDSNPQRECSDGIAAGRPIGLFLSVVALVLFSGLLVAGSPHDDNFMTILAVMKPFENEDWQRIIELERRVAEPILPLIELRRYAWTELGDLPSHFYDRGLSYPVSDDLVSVSSFRLYGKELLLRYGNINHGYRIAINDMQFSRNISPRNIQILFIGAIATEEYELAKRFLLRVEKTPFRGSWCRDAQELLFAMKDRAERQEKTASDGQVVSVKPTTMARRYSEKTEKRMQKIDLMRQLRPAQDYLGGNYDTFFTCLCFADQYRSIEGIPRTWQEIQLVRLLSMHAFTAFEEKFQIYYKDLQKTGAEVPPVLQDGWIYTQFRKTKKIIKPNEFCSEKEVRRFIDYSSKMKKALTKPDPNLERHIFELYGDTSWFLIDCAKNSVYY